MNPLFIQKLRVTRSTSLKLHDLACGAMRFYKAADPQLAYNRFIEAQTMIGVLSTLIENNIRDLEKEGLK